MVATSQVKLGDYVRIDMDSEGRMAFIKEAEGALVPVLLEKYGQELNSPPLARAARTGAKGRGDMGFSSSTEHK